jgi:hypothetical protein
MNTGTFQPTDQVSMNKPTSIKMKPKAEKLDQLIQTLIMLMEDEFTGHLKINFSQGGIGRVEKFEEILKS